MHIDREARKLLSDVLHRYLGNYRSSFGNLLSHVTLNETPFTPRLSLAEPPIVQEFCKRVSDAHRAVSALPEGGGEVLEEHAPYIREALVSERLAVAQRVQAHRTRTLDPNLLEQINRQLEPFDRLIRQQWLRQSPAPAVPQLREFFPLHIVEAIAEKPPRRQRVLDEKFHILQAPSHFQSDLRRARTTGAMRGISCAVAYVDVDDFKRVNTEYSEPFVDVNVLPKLMRALEAHVYKRGYAYRFGGDEYALLLHNCSIDEATTSMQTLRNRVQQLQYLGTKSGFHLTISCGVILVEPGCHLTGEEIELLAARAKKIAKDAGKNRVATFDAPWFETSRTLDG